jgi:hypothetical protein
MQSSRIIILEYRHLLDTSAYLRDHPLHSMDSVIVMGKIKDECNGKPPLEFVGLRRKMYSLLTYVDNIVKRTAKGIKRDTSQNTLDTTRICKRYARRSSNTPRTDCFVHARKDSRRWNAAKLRCAPTMINVPYWKTVSRLLRTVTWSYLRVYK